MHRASADILWLSIRLNIYVTRIFGVGKVGLIFTLLVGFLSSHLSNQTFFVLFTLRKILIGYLFVSHVEKE